jgi:nickel transport protein
MLRTAKKDFRCNPLRGRLAVGRYRTYVTYAGVKMKFIFRAALVLAGLILVPAAVFAHGVEVSEAGAETAALVQTARFMYSTGEPMMYAKIHVYPPSAPDMEILQSITDRSGYFSFLPDEAGEWRISAEDGMGHKGEITLSAAGEDGGGGADHVKAGIPGKLPLPLTALLGLSVIFNVFMLMFFAGSTKKGNSHAH